MAATPRCSLPTAVLGNSPALQRRIVCGGMPKRDRGGNPELHAISTNDDRRHTTLGAHDGSGRVLRANPCRERQNLRLKVVARSHNARDNLCANDGPPRDARQKIPRIAPNGANTGEFYSNCCGETDFAGLGGRWARYASGCPRPGSSSCSRRTEPPAVKGGFTRPHIGGPLCATSLTTRSAARSVGGNMQV